MITAKKIALIATFAAVIAVSDSIPGIPQLQSGVWYSWVFLLEPIVGFVLGPINGFISMLIGVMIGHYIYFRGPFELLFTLGASIGASVSGMLFRRRRTVPTIYFIILLTAYFLTPISHKLPLWGIWNVYLALIILLIIMRVKVKKAGTLIYAFIGLESDILFRIFLLVPLQTYRVFYGFTLETMKLIWIAGAFMTPIQVGLSLIFTALFFPKLKKFVKRVMR